MRALVVLLKAISLDSPLLSPTKQELVSKLAAPDVKQMVGVLETAHSIFYRSHCKPDPFPIS